MKPASELVTTLEREASDFARSTTAQTRMGIAVRLKADETGRIVWSDSKNSVAMLEALIKSGGEPIGLIRIADNASSGGKIMIDSSIFKEYREDLATKTALKKICRSWGDEILRQLSECGEPKATYFGDSCDWLQ